MSTTPAVLKERALMQAVGNAVASEQGCQVSGHLDLRIVGALAEDLLRDGVERQGQAGGQGREHQDVEDQGGTGERIGTAWRDAPWQGK